MVRLKISVLAVLAAVSCLRPAFCQDEISVRSTAPIAVEAPATLSKTPPENFFAKQFYIPPEERLKNGIMDIRGLAFIEKVDLATQTNLAVVTDFSNGALRSRGIPKIKTADAMRTWIDENLKTARYQGVEIKRLSVADRMGQAKNIYWVGHKTFPSVEAAKAAIDSVKAQAVAQGGGFEQMVEQAQTYVETAEGGVPVEIKTQAQYEREEQIALKMLDQLHIGTDLFGPLQGVPSGEPITWQSFGETSWRESNLTKKDYNAQVFYWTNRLVFKGIRAPLNTIDAFVEETTTLESVGPDYKSYLKFYGGLEWRPLARSPFLNNFRPWSMPLLDWAKNIRLFVMYGNRKAAKGEIEGSPDHNMVWGAQVFYEWGIDLPGAGEGGPDSFPDYLRDFTWGEYYGDYHWETTNFSSEKCFNAFIANSSVTLGIRLPGLPLPQNPINNEFVLMPYMRFEHVNNSEFSFDYQNRYFVATGVRWMPFRTYAFKENEWLAKTKIFVEWVGVGGVFNAKQNGDSSYTGPIQHDLRVGLNFSSRRY